MKRLTAVFADQRGYTLVEVVSMLAILSLLSALLIVNTRVGDQRQRIREAANQYVIAAKKAENAATSSQVVGGTARKAYGVCVTSITAVDSGGKCTPAGGTNATAFQVYARTATDATTASAPVSPDIIASYKLPSGVTFTSSPYLDYQPPVPKLTANGLTNNVNLVLSGSNYSQTVVIRPNAGVVYVQ